MNGQDQAKVTTALQQLKPGTKAQWEAIYIIAKSLDPRIPAACLPMLQSSNTGVQRNAARAIGSRWWQIPQDQLSTYVQALKMNLRSKDEPVVNMTRRAIGLLTRTYDGDMFSRSTSGRWVIYERHGKPCLIDTRNHTEQLLGAGLEGTFPPSYNNDSVTRFCLWHPKEDMVALSILNWRGPCPLWVRRPAGEVRSLSFPELKTVLKHANIEVSEQSPIGMKSNSRSGKEPTSISRSRATSEELEKNYAASTHCCAGNLLPTPCASLPTSCREPDPEEWQWQGRLQPGRWNELAGTEKSSTEQQHLDPVS